MRIAVIINPFAGRGRGQRSEGAERAQLAARIIRRAGATGDVAITRGPGHAAVLAHEYVQGGCEIVAAWGGDGTINEVAGPLRGTGTALAIVPAGSGDGLARGLGLPRKAEAALTLALAGLETEIDVGLLGDRHFLNLAGIGFDAAVGEAFNLGGRWGALGYGRQAIAAVWGYRCAPYRIRLDGAELAGPRFLVAFANGPQYGNNLILAADAQFDDGWLDAVVVAEGSAWRQWWRARRLVWRRRRPAEGIHRARIQTASVTGEQLLCHVDGETFQATGTLDVQIEPGALRVAGVGTRV